MARTRLVGRQAEQSALAGWLGEADSGAPRVVVCTGEPGIGKTRLAEEISDVAREHGFTVAWGFGDDTSGAPPYWMWHQVLRDLAPDAEATELSSAPTDDAARFRLFDSIASTVTSAAGNRPVLVVLDDVHWADDGSLLLLRHLARGLREARLLVLVNCRELSGRPGEVLRDLCRAPTTRTLALGGLSAAGVREVLGATTGLALDDSAAESAREATGGNPLFLLELARTTDGEAEAPRLVMTPTIREAITARLTNRSPQCRLMLRAASVVGLYFSPDVVGPVAGESPSEVTVALNEAVAASLVEQHDGQFRFVHALIREAILADIEPSERAALHGRAASVLVRHGTATADIDVFGVARHLINATEQEPLDAAQWCERAATVAMQRLAYEDAARWYRTALRIGGDALSPADRSRLLLGIGSAAGRSGDLSGRLTACMEAADLARQHLLPDVVAQAALTMEPSGTLGFDLATRRLCEEALSALPESETLLRARLMARFAATFVYRPDPDAALTASATALDHAEESADPVAIAEACRARLAIAAGPAELADRERLASRLEQVSRQTGDPHVSLSAHLARIDTAFERGDLLEVTAALESAASAAERVGGPIAKFLVLHSRAALAQARGQFTDARATIMHAFTMMAAGDVEARFHTRAAVLSMIGRHVGPDAETLAAAGYVDAPAGIKEEPGVIVALSYAATLVAAGELESARAAYRSTGPSDQWRVAPHVALLVPALGIAAATSLGERADVEHFAATLTPYADHHVVSGVGAITYGGPVDLWLGIAARHLGELDRAVERLARARVTCRQIGARGYEVEAATELAEVLKERADHNDHVRASEIASSARTLACDLGMDPFVSRLDLLEPASRPRDEGPLTRRQLEVAELVAAGLTNRQIAERLTLSERTAENHVQHIMDRLGLTNRSGIAVWVTERKLSTQAE